MKVIQVFKKIHELDSLLENNFQQKIAQYLPVFAVGKSRDF